MHGNPEQENGVLPDDQPIKNDELTHFCLGELWMPIVGRSE